MGAVELKRRHGPCTRSRRVWLLPLALWAALGVPRAEAAAFLPGQADPDPPTGDLPGPAPTPAEPLAAGKGIQWALAPWRWRGSVTLDARWLRLEDGRRSNQGLMFGDMEFASYVWQPWFIQLRAGAGVLAGRDSGQGGDAPPSSGSSAALTGRVQVTVFPASRFPFEFRADLSDTRAGGDTLVNDYRTLRLGLSQAWRPEQGNENYTFNLDHSRVQGAEGFTDRLTTVHATGARQWAEHSLDLGLNLSANTRSGTDDRNRQTTLSAHHSWQPESAFNAETLASWNQLRLRLGHAPTALSVGSDVLQLSSFAGWRPRPGDWLYSETAPLTLAASARVMQTEAQGEGSGQRARVFNLSVGGSKELSRAWRVGAALSWSRLETAAAAPSNQSAANTSVVFTPDSLAWGEWRYTPSASASLNLNQTPEAGHQQTVGLQGSHGVSRSWPLGTGQVISFNLSQSAGLLRETPRGLTSRGLSHALGLFWQSAGEGTSQSFVSFSVSDSRTHSQGDGRFQFLNLQLNRRTQLSRYNSWSADLTLQASRSSAEQLDAFTGVLRPYSQGWQRYYTGSLSFESQRVFGVPKLRFTGLLSANSQQLERRANGDIDAPLEHITESLEARLDYTIGRLETRLSARAARVDGRSVAALMARAQRRF